MTPDLDLEHDVVRALTGDTAALAELNGKWYPAIRRVVRWQLLNRQVNPTKRRLIDSEDLTQEVLIEVWRRSQHPNLETRCALALLQTIINRVVRKALRHVSAARRNPSREELAAVDELGIPSAENLAAHEEELTDIADVLSRELGPDEKALWDCCCNGLSWRDIGAELGIGAEAARKRFDRLIKKLSLRLRRRIEGGVGIANLPKVVGQLPCSRDEGASFLTGRAK